MIRVVRAESDAALGARVTLRTPLFYSAGPAGDRDRPAHVRAGSGAAWWQGRIAVVQDDTSFVALVDPATRHVDAVELPWAPGGARQFDVKRGNKADKLDLEAACVVANAGDSDVLFAFGSGSTPERERIVLLRAESGGRAVAELVPAPLLYAALRADRGFAGSELNVEGVAFDGAFFWFVQRGNGAPRDGLVPVNALAAVPRDDLLALVSGEARAPRVERVVQYSLGDMEGISLSFTDVTAAPGGALSFLATAEASPDAVRDGPVTGTVIGVVTGEHARWTLLTNADGTAFREKAEGLALVPVTPGNANRALLVVDADDPDRPSELCEVDLEGDWGF